MAKNKTVAQMSNFVVYQVKGEINLQELDTTENNKHRIASPCGPNDLETIGFIPFVDEDGGSSIIKSLAGCDVVNIGVSTKDIPKQEIKKFVAQKMKEHKEKLVNEEEGTELTDKELEAIFEDSARAYLAPLCFSKETETLIFHDKEDGLLFVGTNSPKKAEGFTYFLRSLLGSLPIIPLTTNVEPTVGLTKMLVEGVNTKISLGDFVELKGVDEDNKGETVTLRKINLYDDPLYEECYSHYYVNKLQLENDGCVTFTTNLDLVLSGIKYASYVYADSDGDFDGTFVLLSNELRGIVNNLTNELGGIK